ncbi:MAG TPA: helix-turn-helix transcriptional regulator [Aggregatilineales bacterium]|nr:helix-turn-helix transcriptional regulator [Aggregatilineales bacterium]
MEKDARHVQLSEFLRSRRARIALSDVGLPNIGRRRTPGLRREEVAQLAGVSVDWYTWLEQGRAINPSEQVLTSIARILRLNETETRYLFTLVYGGSTTSRVESVSPLLQAMLDSLDVAPAKVMNHCWDIVAWNRAYCALFGDMGAIPAAERNCLWHAFADPLLRQILVDWEGYMRDVVAQFRADYGANPSDPYFAEIIERLLAVSPEFREWWPRHDVRSRGNRRKEYNHPLVGHLVVEKMTLQMSEYPDLRIVIQIPVPGTATEERIRQLIEMTNVALMSVN